MPPSPLRRTIAAPLLACCLALGQGLPAAEGEGSRELGFAIPDHGDWRMTLPAGVHVQLPTEERAGVGVIRFAPEHGEDWRLALACAPYKGGGELTDLQIRNEFIRVGKGIALLSVEKKCNAESIVGGAGRGYFARFTDASLVGVEPLPAGAYRHLVVAAYAIGNHILVFTYAGRSASVADEARLFALITSLQQD